MGKLTNSLGIELPDFIEGYGKVRPYLGPFSEKALGESVSTPLKSHIPGQNKILSSLKEAIEKSGLKDGMTISFHHHLRDGDHVLNKVMDEIAHLGFKNLVICASSLTDAHEPLLEHIKSGVVVGLHTSGLRGKIGKEVSLNHILKNPVIFRTHGGRPRAIENGEIKIDVAFIAAPSCDEMGNMNGSKGKSAFGAMGYPVIDAQYAGYVVAITDNLVPYPNYPITINQTHVDTIVVIDEIGDPALIATGATRITSNPTDLIIAENAARVLISSGLVKEGFSFQAGSGGASLAVAKFLRDYMKTHTITGSFASGGITSYLVELLEEGLFKALFDAQTFDGNIADSFLKHPNHIEMSASLYANPNNKGCVAHQLDIMILSATEIDIHFNINSLTGSTGMIMGALGGAPDTAAGSKLTVVVAPSIRKRIPIVVDKVTTIVTPGDTIDILVTERGICVNPRRTDLIEKLKESHIDIMEIDDLKKDIETLTGIPEKLVFTDIIVGVVEYRDGSVIDIIRQIK